MSLTTSNLTSGFIDLATFDEIERYLYGTLEATAYFVRETRKSTWFTQVPVMLSNSSGSPQFGQDWSVSVSRAGDYLLHSWLRVTVPSITAVSGYSGGLLVRWCANLMHNLVKECNITFNDLVAARFDNYHLDFWAAFTVPDSKRVGYNNMIGNVTTLTLPTAPHLVKDGVTGLPSATLNLPLPFFFARDSGVALPTAALPYNEMRINFSFRDWTELLILESTSGTTERRVVPSVSTHVGSAVTNPLSTTPVLSNVAVWANYAIVSNDERKRMACAPRDILIEQVQTAPRQTFAPVTNNQPSYDIRFSHAIKALFFSARNKTFSNEWSNYSTVSPQAFAAGSFVPGTANGYDPISQTSLVYENTARLSQMGSDYFSLVNPWYHAPSIPDKTGFHCYSYSLDFFCLDPMGSTNYGKLTNVSIRPEASPSAQMSSSSTASVTGGVRVNAFDQSYDFIVTVINNNIIRVSGGALGFPVL
jgi:hypothetical protein